MLKEQLGFGWVYCSGVYIFLDSGLPFWLPPVILRDVDGISIITCLDVR